MKCKTCCEIGVRFREESNPKNTFCNDLHQILYYMGEGIFDEFHPNQQDKWWDWMKNHSVKQFVLEINKMDILLGITEVFKIIDSNRDRLAATMNMTFSKFKDLLYNNIIGTDSIKVYKSYITAFDVTLDESHLMDALSDEAVKILEYIFRHLVADLSRAFYIISWSDVVEAPKALAVIIEDGRIDVSLNNNSTLLFAIQALNYDSVKLLLNDERVRNTFTIEKAKELKTHDITDSKMRDIFTSYIRSKESQMNPAIQGKKKKIKNKISYYY